MTKKTLPTAAHTRPATSPKPHTPPTPPTPPTPFTGSAVKELHAEDFVLTKNPVQLDSRHLPGYIMFYAEWCGHCHHQIPALKEFATQATGRCGVYAVDCSTPDRNPLVQQAVPISGYPTFFRVDPQTRELQEGSYHVAGRSAQELEGRIADVSTKRIKQSGGARRLEAVKPIPSVKQTQPRLCQGRTYNGLFRCTQRIDDGQTYCWRHGGSRRQY